MSPSHSSSLKRGMDKEVKEDKSIKKEKWTGQSRPERAIEHAKSQPVPVLPDRNTYADKAKSLPSCPIKSLSATNPTSKERSSSHDGGYLLHWQEGMKKRPLFPEEGDIEAIVRIQLC